MECQITPRILTVVIGYFQGGSLIDVNTQDVLFAVVLYIARQLTAPTMA
jgi:hypothetical protein